MKSAPDLSHEEGVPNTLRPNDLTVRTVLLERTRVPARRFLTHQSEAKAAATATSCGGPSKDVAFGERHRGEKSRNVAQEAPPLSNGCGLAP